VSHTDDNARAGSGPASGAGPAGPGGGGPGPLSRRAFVGGLAGAAGLGLAACSSGLKGGGSTSTGTIKIGFVSPMTGPDAAFATANPFVLTKVRQAFATGLTIGGKKYKVEIVTADSQSSDTRAAQVAQQLITQDNVDIMLTTSAPETVNPVSDQCEAAHVPCLGTIVPWQSWFLGRGGKIGKTAATSTSFTYTYLYFIGLEDELAAQGPGWKLIPTNRVVGGLWPSDADGQAFRGAFTPALPKEGYKVYDPGPYPDGTTDFTTIINKFKAHNCEILFGCPLPPDFLTFWKQASQMSYKPRIAAIAKALLFPSVVNALGPLGKNLSTDAWWTPTVPFKSSLTGMTAAQYASEFQAATGQQWQQPMSFNYAVFEIAAHAFKAAGDPHDKQAVAAAIGAAKGEVITGKYDFTDGPVKNVATHPDYMAQWQVSKDPKFMYELVIVDNAADPTVPVTAKLLPL
jgi:branched-chain amino acid transport system substrate-binding protein